MSNLHDLALETIRHLNERPHSPERAAHKFNMISIAEKSALGMPLNHDVSTASIIAAAEWCERVAA